MAVATAETIKTNDGPFSLIYGDPGSGKTTFVKEAPTPLLFFECGIDGGRKVLFDTEDIYYEDTPIGSNDPNILPSTVLLNKLDAYYKDGTLKSFKTIVIDPATNLMLDGRALKAKAKGKDLTFYEQGIVRDGMVDLFKYLYSLSRLGFHIVVITHATEKVLKNFNDLSEAVNIVPYLSHGMLKDAYNMFDNVVRLSSSNGVRFMDLAEAPGIKAKARALEDTLGKQYVPTYSNFLDILAGETPGKLAFGSDDKK